MNATQRNDPAALEAQALEIRRIAEDLPTGLNRTSAMDLARKYQDRAIALRLFGS